MYTDLMLDYLQVSVHAADVKKVLRTYSIEVSASTPTDLKQVRTYEFPNWVGVR